MSDTARQREPYITNKHGLYSQFFQCRVTISHQSVHELYYFIDSRGQSEDKNGRGVLCTTSKALL